MNNPKGYFSLMLHAHLPYVRHPDFEEFLEERWLFEAITETYIPLIKMFKNLERDKVQFHLTMSITPPLMEMLGSDDLNQKYSRHMEKLIELCEKEVVRTKDEDLRKHKMAKFYLADFKETYVLFYHDYNQRLLDAFREYQDKGYIEIVTCNGTHGFLPFMQQYPSAIRAQMDAGVKTYERFMKRSPKGVWLAECAYFPGAEKYLSEYGINYFFTDSHALWFADEPAHYGVYRPVMTDEGVFAFARDPESSEQVWSATVGYPGDFRYREFYRDIGFDREIDYIKPYIDRSGVRCNVGIKYHKISGKDVEIDRKDYYDIDEAKQAVKEHATDFLNKKIEQTKRLYGIFDGEVPLITAPFDAELFGHWWYEGPLFLEELFRIMDAQQTVKPETVTSFLTKIDSVQVTTPCQSTWGANGYNEVWLNGSNDWIYRHLHQATEIMVCCAKKYEQPDSLKRRVLNQMARELLLAQSSDWAFIMTTGTTVEYAVSRTKNHIKRFFDLKGMLETDTVDETFLKYLEWIDKIFEDIDFSVYSKV